MYFNQLSELNIFLKVYKNIFYYKVFKEMYVKAQLIFVY